LKRIRDLQCTVADNVRKIKCLYIAPSPAMKGKYAGIVSCT